MKRRIVLVLLISFVFTLSGCIIRTYTVTKERPDQDLSTGNRGYIQGQPPKVEAGERKTQRTTKVVEVELYPLIRFDTKPKHKAPEKPVIEEPKTEEVGNEGYITRTAPFTKPIQPEEIQKYTVQKGDTLQKISEKFYGTTKKWTVIYEANKTILKAPDRIYPGQIINIPVESTEVETKNEAPKDTGEMLK